MKRDLTCIICPLSCRIEVEVNGELKVTGYKCPRGREWAIQEVLNPKRVVITVLKVEGGDLPVVSVKTDPLPKEEIPTLMRELARVRLRAPIEVGQVVAQVRGYKVYATREVPSKGFYSQPGGEGDEHGSRAVSQG